MRRSHLVISLSLLLILLMTSLDLTGSASIAIRNSRIHRRLFLTLICSILVIAILVCSFVMGIHPLGCLDEVIECFSSLRDFILIQVNLGRLDHIIQRRQ